LSGQGLLQVWAGGSDLPALEMNAREGVQQLGVAPRPLCPDRAGILQGLGDQTLSLIELAQVAEKLGNHHDLPGMAALVELPLECVPVAEQRAEEPGETAFGLLQAQYPPGWWQRESKLALAPELVDPSGQGAPGKGVRNQQCPNGQSRGRQDQEDKYQR
jgi:hypothetical protein